MLNIYRASAGSGKTFRLTQDYIRLLFKSFAHIDRPHRRILAVTFTNKATDEMKSRILQELFLLSQNEKSGYRDSLVQEFGLSEMEVNERAGKILIRILHDYSSFSISTIDRFFQQVIRAFAREIGVNGGYNLELDTATTLQQAVDNLFVDLSDKENAQLLNWMTTFLEERIEKSESWDVRKTITGLGQEIFKENYQYEAEETRNKLHNREFLRTYQGKLRKIISDYEEKIISTAEEMLLFLADNQLEPEYFSRQMMHKTLENLKSKDFELKSTFLKYADSPESCYTNSQSSAVKDLINGVFYNGLKERLDLIIYLLGEGMSHYNSANLILKHLNTLGILSDLALQIKKLTSEQNIMLISDTNQLLNKIIDNSDTPFVYERTGTHIGHYMIDEFQDTSALQWKNFKPLVTNSLSYGNYNMVVGDVKQSIYRWRNSDWKLLDEQINNDIPTSQLTHQTLNTNWRSDKNIIFFNNAFFSKAAILLQEKLNEEIQISIEGNALLETLKSRITHAYSDVKQEISPNASTGRVKFEFIPQDENEDGWQQAALERIPSLLEKLVDQGYKPSDIAFLVRKNSEETKLMEFLLAYKKSPEARKDFSYEVVGSEGLALTSSPSVNFIIALLSLVFNPNDSINRAIVHYEYLCGKQKQTNLHFVNSDTEEAEAGTNLHFSIFNAEENECVEEIRHLALFDATEKIINTFNLEAWYGETVFLQAFQDTVFKFVQNKNADLNSFLHWWKINGPKQYISAPENQQAFRVMTIHKSKGLDFKVVIIPFCDWTLDATKNRPLLWCKPTESPFNELPILPIEYGKKLANSIFREDYFDEKMHQYIDNLNLAYVAFTRARNEMICFTPKAKDEKSLSLEKINNLSDLLQSCLSSDTELTDFWQEETIFEIGESSKAVYKEKKAERISKKLTSYPITASDTRLQLRHASTGYWETASLTESRLDYGIVMHEILRQTIRKGDEEKAIAQQLTAGRINYEDEHIIREELKQFWAAPETDEWFAPDAEVLNEATILLPSGQHYRPDRVIIKNNKATVIDYKFGKEEHSYYLRQLKRYSDFISRMGYREVDSFLYYVSLGKIVRG